MFFFNRSLCAVQFTFGTVVVVAVVIKKIIMIVIINSSSQCSLKNIVLEVSLMRPPVQLFLLLSGEQTYYFWVNNRYLELVPDSKDATSLLATITGSNQQRRKRTTAE